MNDKIDKMCGEVAYLFAQILSVSVTESQYQQPLNSFGIDSLDYLDFVYILEEKYNLRLKTGDIVWKNATVYKIAEKIANTMD